MENKDFILKNVKNFDLGQTLECGQCFHFKKLGESEYGLVAFGKLLHVKQQKDTVIFYNTSEDEYQKVWMRYFDLDRDYGEIKDYLLDRDDHLKSAIETMQGVRILRQEFFEILISFIISQNKQIPHIKQIVETISRKFGTYVGNIGEEEFFAFPDSEKMKHITLEELRECKTGFRAPYILDAVIKVNDLSIHEEFLKKADLQICAESLMKIKGVGEKISNCVMLYGLEKREAFPIDVWMKRIMEFIYFDRQATIEEIACLAKEKFGQYGGYAQQYLFYYGRENKLGK